MAVDYPLPKYFSLSMAVLKSMLNLFFFFLFFKSTSHLLNVHDREKADLAFFIFKTVPKSSKQDNFIISEFFSHKVQWFIGLELILNHISMKLKSQ